MTRASHWLDKAEKLAVLAEAKRKTPEGDVALSKLKLIQERHPEVVEQVTKSRPLLFSDLSIMELAEMIDLGEMKLRGISLEGSWTADNMDQAVRLMLLEYLHRLRANKSGRLLHESRSLLKEFND